MTQYALNMLVKNPMSILAVLQDELFVTAAPTRIVFALNIPILKPQKASLDAMDIIKLAGGIFGWVLVKYYAVYKKWVVE